MFYELARHVETKLGDAAWLEEIRKTGLKRTEYVWDKQYPDQELFQLVAAVAARTGTSMTAVLEDLGEAMVPAMLRVYSVLIDPKWTLFDFLLNTELVIHSAVRIHHPDSRPPVIRVDRTAPAAVRITYRSGRRLCAVARGIVRGAAAHYGVAVEMTDDACMLRGDPECVLTVRGK